MCADVVRFVVFLTFGSMALACGFRLFLLAWLAGQALLIVAAVRVGSFSCIHIAFEVTLLYIALMIQSSLSDSIFCMLRPLAR